MSLPYDASNPAVSAAKERETFLAGKALVSLIEQGHPAARHHHAQVAGERLHAGAGAGRLDQRGAAPDGDRPRGRRRVDAGRLRSPRRQGAAPGRPQAGRQVRHVRPAPGRRHARRCCGPCSTPACCTATASPCTGETLAENLKDVPSIYQRKQDVVQPLERPMHATGHIVILHGNLAPDGAVAKVAGLKKRKITGPAKVFDGEEACFAAIQDRQIKAGRRGRHPRRRAGRRPRHARDAVGHGGAGRAGTGREASA